MKYILENREFHDKIKEVFMDKLIEEEKKCFISKFSGNFFLFQIFPFIIVINLQKIFYMIIYLILNLSRLV